MNINDRFIKAGDGMTDASELIQAQLDSEGRDIYIPQGCYMIKTPLVIHSGTKLTASKNARFILDGTVTRRRGDFLLTNDGDNSDITLIGGVWDGNNTGKGNAKPDIFDENGYSGTVLNFCGVSGLVLRDIIVANSVTYNIRMAKIDGFTIDNIGFLSDNFGNNQDGLHFNGKVRNGTVRDIRALSKGQTNDDLIALNADDSMVRVENRGMCTGEIENITFENLFAEDCHTIIRLLSVNSPIRNISVKNVYGGYRCNAINVDGARYCRTPLFNEEDRKNGVGIIENVIIENMHAYPTTENNSNPAVVLESLSDNFNIHGFRLSARKGITAGTAFRARNLVGQSFLIDGKSYHCLNKSDIVKTDDFYEFSSALVK